MSTENPINPSDFELDEARRAEAIKQHQKELGDSGIFYEDYLTDLEGLARHHGNVLNRDDLLFLYRLPGATKEVFAEAGNAELEERRNQLFQLVCEKRDHSLDLSIILECERSQIANTVDQITENTVAYIGPLEPDIFNRLPENVEHVYTKFPERKVRFEQLEIGGQTEDELETALEQSNVGFYPARTVMRHPEFYTQKNLEEIKLVRLSVADLGFPRGALFIEQIFERIKALGLELCPPEVGPKYRLQYTNQAMNEWVSVGMKPIADSDFGPSVFTIGRNLTGARLSVLWSGPGDLREAGSQILFRWRKPARP